MERLRRRRSRVGRGRLLREAIADRLPPVLRERRLISSRAALGALAVVAAVCVGVLARGATAAGPQLLGVPEPAGTGTPGLTTPSPAPSEAVLAAGTAGPSGATGTIGAPVLVHVVGQVRSPGVVRLDAGARVQDAVEAAGGPKPTADLSLINLARQVVDGEQIVVPRSGQTLPPSAGAVGGQGPGASGGTAVAPVDLNTATESQLDALPGIGPVLAGRIVAWRTEHGRFTRVEELTEVDGIGERVLARLRQLVTV